MALHRLPLLLKSQHQRNERLPEPGRAAEPPFPPKTSAVGRLLPAAKTRLTCGLKRLKMGRFYACGGGCGGCGALCAVLPLIRAVHF
jgi:hypothetical protein